MAESSREADVRHALLLPRQKRFRRAAGDALDRQRQFVHVQDSSDAAGAAQESGWRRPSFREHGAKGNEMDAVRDELGARPERRNLVAESSVREGEIVFRAKIRQTWTHIR